MPTPQKLIAEQWAEWSSMWDFSLSLSLIHLSHLSILKGTVEFKPRNCTIDVPPFPCLSTHGLPSDPLQLQSIDKTFGLLGGWSSQTVLT